MRLPHHWHLLFIIRILSDSKTDPTSVFCYAMLITATTFDMLKPIYLVIHIQCVLPRLCWPWNVKSILWQVNFQNAESVVLALNNTWWLGKPYWTQMSTQFDILAINTINATRQMQQSLWNGLHGCIWKRLFLKQQENKQRFCCFAFRLNSIFIRSNKIMFTVKGIEKD